MAMCSSWAHLWALSRLLGPVTSLGSSLNDRHSPWASGQLGKAGQSFWAWTGLDWGVQHSDTHRTLWHTPWQELCWLTPESAVLNILSFAHLLTHLAVLAVLAVLATSGPTLGTKMSQGLLRLCWAWFFNRDQRLHWKNHFNCCFVQVAAWAFIAQISCHRC